MCLFRDRSEGLIAGSTLKSYDLSARTLIEIVGDKEKGQYTIADLDRFKAEYLRKVSPSSVNVVLRSPKAIWSRAVEWGEITNNVLSRVKLVRIPQQPPQYLDRERQIHLLSVVDDLILKMLFELHFNTGLRIGEALALGKKC